MDHDQLHLFEVKLTSGRRAVEKVIASKYGWFVGVVVELVGSIIVKTVVELVGSIIVKTVVELVGSIIVKTETEEIINYEFLVAL